MTETRQLPLTEAARLLGISRRTAQRRLTDGTLTGVKVGQKWLIDVDLAQVAAPEPRQDSATSAYLAELGIVRAQLTEALTECNTLRQDCATVRAECATLARRATDLESERDYLRQALAAALTLGQQRLLPERAESGRAWWKVWRRGT